MSQFADAGHRVFYVSLSFRASGPPWEIAEKRPNVYEVALRAPAKNVYRHVLDDEACQAFFGSLAALRRDLSLGATVTFVQLPFWWPLARSAREAFAWPVVYDCMDHHAGFSEVTPEMLGHEGTLLSCADLVLVSSGLLAEAARRHTDRVLHLPNACDYDHFALPSRPHGERPVIGYYGALEDWFDADLVADLAERRPDWSFVLVGRTVGADTSRLSRLDNVSLCGEQPYSAIPEWLDRFDVAIVPFKRTPLTEATNPVKAYEILAAGKPIVSVPIPEMALLGDLVRLAGNPEEFEREIEAGLLDEDRATIEARRAFAREHTWSRRFGVLAPATRGVFPLVSVVVATANDPDRCRRCIESLFGRTEWPNFEAIVVSGASGERMREPLEAARRRFPDLRVFGAGDARLAAACNRGLDEARGDLLVVLTSDAVMTRGGVTAMVSELQADPAVGLVATGGPAPLCLATRRSVFLAVGPLDEGPGIGGLEDDYARRVRAKGYRVVAPAT